MTKIETGCQKPVIEPMTPEEPMTLKDLQKLLDEIENLPPDDPLRRIPIKPPAPDGEPPDGKPAQEETAADAS